MRRGLGVIGCALAVAALAVGCADGNDRPDVAADTSAADTTTTTGRGPFGGSGGATTSTPGSGTTATTAAEGGEASGGGGGGGGGGGSGSAAPTSPVDADRPSDLASALGDACTDYADTAPALQQPGTTAEGTCLFGGEVINLYTFADVAAQRAFVDEGAFFDCGFIVAFGGGGSTWYVAGDGWIARPGTEGVARDLAAALDGEMAVYTCEA